jgi:hypothetical protein
MTEHAPTPARARAGTTQRMLRSPLSVIGATLASFLVVLALLTARVTSGHEASPPAGGGAGSTLVVHRGGKVLRTTASGRVLGPATNVAAGQQGSGRAAAQPAVLLTRTSGAAGAGGQDD